MGLPKILKDLLSLPTAPYVETAILDYIRAVCAGLPGVSCRTDRYGNLLARYRHAPAGRAAIAFAAHTDHPGFVAQEMLDGRTVRATFCGFVESSYFIGTRIRFWSGGRWVGGAVSDLTQTVPVVRPGQLLNRPAEVLARVEAPVEPDAPGMWDLPAPALDGDLVRGVALDDLIGTAAMLVLLQRLSKKRVAADVYCLFTRAEEAALIGAIGAAQARTIPRAVPIVAIEASPTLPNARIGDGPILRVGDRMSVFTPELAAFGERVAQRLGKRRKTFRFQRKLMDGGTCESTAYVAYGYRAGGVCLALGNYHNMDREHGKIASEFVSLSDWRGMVDWFEAMVEDGLALGKSEYLSGVRGDLDRRFMTQLPLLTGGKRGS